jgi:D-beta-D-heptose 7-phosphate kinase/D-beta-D-heptose 1-phosphate adenosyltransferase
LTVGRVLDWNEAASERRRLTDAGKSVVFTNGVFDLLHRGHVDLLMKSRALGDALIVGLNSDASTTRLKGPSRPFVPAGDRAEVLAALTAVDIVVIFDEDTPAELIRRLTPDILVKGADYGADEIVGRDTVEAGGGRVERVPLVEGWSTTRLIGEIVERMKLQSRGQKENG